MVRYIESTLAGIPALLTPTLLRTGASYSWADAKADAIAGITVAIIQIPQSMALALIAGLPAVYGLYASLFGFVASLWGSSRFLSTGPVAIVSFLTLTALVPLATPGSPHYIQLAATLALLVGLIYLAVGLFRFGFILQLVPHSVIVGFSAAAAVIIVVTQIPTLLGISFTQSDIVYSNIVAIIAGIPHVSYLATMIGVSAMVLLLFSRRLPSYFPGSLILLVGGIALSIALGLGSHGVALVREVPQALPAFLPPWFDVGSLTSLIPRAAIIALVGYVQAHASARAVAKKTREHLDTNQELVGQGLANVVTSLFQGFPISGSFTRTAINVEAGARTGISSAVTAFVTVIALLFFTPLFFFLPRTILAAIVIMSAIPLINIQQLQEMYRISPTDGSLAFLTFFLSFVLKSDDAIILGILVALTLFIRQTVFGKHVNEIGLDRNLHILSAFIEEKEVDTFPGVAVVRIGMAIYYANASHMMREIDEIIARNVLREGVPVKTLVLDVSGVNFIDVTAIEVLEEYFETLRERDITPYAIYMRPSVYATLKRVPNFPPFKIFSNIAEMRSAVWFAHK